VPRKARIVVPGVAHYVVQRGHNRQVVFATDEDFQFYLENLAELRVEFSVKLYAYCLMTNHVHLLLAPTEATSLALLLKRLAARYTCYINRLEGRSGTLWEGRYKSSPVETATYLLECSRYIELNPVRASMVLSPKDYRWSSYGCKTGLGADARLDFDPCYLAIGETEALRQQRYREFVSQGVRPSEQTLIQEALQRGQLTGTQRFVEEIEAKLGVRVEPRGRGRPPKSEK
jgi:Transposase and inactivated derivatives